MIVSIGKAKPKQLWKLLINTQANAQLWILGSVLTINKTGQKALIIRSKNNKWTGKICVVGQYLGRFEAGDSFVHRQRKVRLRVASHIFEVNDVGGVDIPSNNFFLFNDTSMMPLPDLHEDETIEEKMGEPETI